MNLFTHLLNFVVRLNRSYLFALSHIISSARYIYALFSLIDSSNVSILAIIRKIKDKRY